MDELSQLNSTYTCIETRPVDEAGKPTNEKVSEYEANIRLANRESYEIRSGTEQGHEMSKRNRI